ncbi:MAG: succinate dehydrogenase cytochrome b subunit [Planctomycetota bacterium]|nr:succinate dehydrogenase cytochrome b subunit [Planctomycetota bacterium]
MNWLLRGLRSSVGLKFVMAVTGLLLFGFVLAHLAGNLQIFAGADQLNGYAKSLQDLGPLLWVARGGLLAIFVLHVGTGVMLARRNRAARGTPYAVQKAIDSTHASRAMVSTGVVVMIFVVYHLMHFTLGVGIRPEFHDWTDPQGRHDVYSMVVAGFQQLPIALFYIVSMLGLGVHLSHGLASMFQSLGWNQPKYRSFTRLLGIGITAVIILGNISMPVAAQFGLIELPEWNPLVNGGN